MEPPVLLQGDWGKLSSVNGASSSLFGVKGVLTSRLPWTAEVLIRASPCGPPLVARNDDSYTIFLKQFYYPRFLQSSRRSSSSPYPRNHSLIEPISQSAACPRAHHMDSASPLAVAPWHAVFPCISCSRCQTS